MLIGAIYGVLQAIQDPFIIHPAQFLLDYPIAFSTVGLGGIFSEIKAFKKCPQIPLLLGGLLVGVFRFMAHGYSKKRRLKKELITLNKRIGSERNVICLFIYKDEIFHSTALQCRKERKLD